jgi:hypothetical protein
MRIKRKAFNLPWKKIVLTILLSLAIAVALIVAPKMSEAARELDSELVSADVKGVPYKIGGAPVEVMTDEVFRLAINMKNTGTEVWGHNLDQGQRGASLLSRGADYNDTFGVFYISPGQGQRTQPGEAFLYDASLRAPSEPGEYTMAWQLADWIIPYNSRPGMDYTTRPFYGSAVTVKVLVRPRTEGPPPEKPRVPGVLDIHDLEYAGSFTLPSVPGIPQGDAKAFFRSGIALRTADGEKRMLLATGTYRHSLYEVAIPVPGKIVGNDASAVPEAQFRTVFGELTIDAEANSNGTMWYDQASDLFYWTNLHIFDARGANSFPTLRSARISGGVLAEERQWFLPAPPPSHYKAYWGGVTGIPDSFAERYTGGSRLALGFGGSYSIIQTVSMGPSLAAISPNMQTGEMDF